MIGKDILVLVKATVRLISPILKRSHSLKKIICIEGQPRVAWRSRLLHSLLNSLLHDLLRCRQVLELIEDIRHLLLELLNPLDSIVGRGLGSKQFHQFIDVHTIALYLGQFNRRLVLELIDLALVIFEAGRVGIDKLLVCKNLKVGSETADEKDIDKLTVFNKSQHSLLL